MLTSQFWKQIWKEIEWKGHFDCLLPGVKNITLWLLMCFVGEAPCCWGQNLKNYARLCDSDNTSEKTSSSKATFDVPSTWHETIAIFSMVTLTNFVWWNTMSCFYGKFRKKNTQKLTRYGNSDNRFEKSWSRKATFDCLPPGKRKIATFLWWNSVGWCVMVIVMGFWGGLGCISCQNKKLPGW